MFFQCILCKERKAAISSIIIDGYNLIGIHHRDLHGQREKLILQLIDYKKIKGHDITVVFDGWKSGGGREERAVRGGIRVIYSRLGEKADAVIKEAIRSEKKEWIVVTSDRDIISHAWSCGAVPVPSEEFQSILERRDGPLTGKYDLIDEDYEGNHQRKGNPQTHSKREKSLMRARKKL